MYPNVESKAPAAGTVAADSVTAQLVRVLTWLILVVCLFVWAVVGFVFWVPLLIRATVRFSVSLVAATLNRQGAARAGMMLREAVNFYRRGFLVAIDAVLRNPTRDPDALDAEREVKLGSIVGELGWAAIIWYALLLWLGVVTTTPIELWGAVAAVPWFQMFSDASVSAATFLRGLMAR